MRISKIADYFSVEHSLRLPPVAFCRTDKMMQTDVLTSASFASRHKRGRALLSDAPQERTEMSNKGAMLRNKRILTGGCVSLPVAPISWKKQENYLPVILSLRRCQIAHFLKSWSDAASKIFSAPRYD